MFSFILLVAVFFAGLAQRIAQDVSEHHYGDLWLYIACSIGLGVAVCIKLIGL